MDPSQILVSVAILGGVGLTFGTLIALAHAKLKVWRIRASTPSPTSCRVPIAERAGSRGVVPLPRR